MLRACVPIDHLLVNAILQEEYPGLGVLAIYSARGPSAGLRLRFVTQRDLRFLQVFTPVIGNGQLVTNGMAANYRNHIRHGLDALPVDLDDDVRLFKARFVGRAAGDDALDDRARVYRQAVLLGQGFVHGLTDDADVRVGDVAFIDDLVGDQLDRLDRNREANTLRTPALAVDNAVDADDLAFAIRQRAA